MHHRTAALLKAAIVDAPGMGEFTDALDKVTSGDFDYRNGAGGEFEQ